MSRAQLIEEVHLSVYVPCGLPEAEYEAVRQTLDDARFQARLWRAVRDAFRQQQSLCPVRVRLSR
jgi:hypothetical protein